MIWLILLIITPEILDSTETCRKLDKYCGCDDQCGKYGDCCLNHAEYNKTNPSLLLLSCLSMSDFVDKIWVVDKCPETSDGQLASYCRGEKINHFEPFKSFVPVYSVSGLVYKNSFCAKCHSDENHFYPKVVVKCDGLEIASMKEANEKMRNGQCTATLTNEHPIGRPCLPDLIRTCPQVTRNLSENCSTGADQIMSDGMLMYRNRYCCECNNVTCSVVLADFVNSFSYVLNFNDWVENMADFDNQTVLGTQGNTTTIIDSTFFYACFSFTLLSIASLTLLIIIYSTKSMFHNFGGYLTICLSCCVLIMDVLILIVTNPSVTKSSFCRLIGIFQHFIVLSNFVWMALYALDLVQTFALASSTSGKKKTMKTFVLYLMMGFGLSMGFVGGATVTEYFALDNCTWRPKYGGDHCWFTNKIGGIVWYFLPVCVLLIWNCVTCVLVFYKLSKTSKECRMVKKTESKSTMWICVRLSAVFGVGYIVQIIAVVSRVNALIQIGSLVNCLQGFFLAVCFMWTKRVRIVVTSTMTHINLYITSTGVQKDNRRTTTTTTTATLVTDKKQSEDL